MYWRSTIPPDSQPKLSTSSSRTTPILSKSYPTVSSVRTIRSLLDSSLNWNTSQSFMLNFSLCQKKTSLSLSSKTQKDTLILTRRFLQRTVLKVQIAEKFSEILSTVNSIAKFWVTLIALSKIGLTSLQFQNTQFSKRVWEFVGIFIEKKLVWWV